MASVYTTGLYSHKSFDIPGNKTHQTVVFYFHTIQSVNKKLNLPQCGSEATAEGFVDRLSACL